MPELYPGGKVGFPEHDLQMYIEEVEHSWSYTDGFTTTASLSAPSVYGSLNAGKKLPANMVKALIEPSNSAVVEDNAKKKAAKKKTLKRARTPRQPARRFGGNRD
jgi:hypothetical protein